MELKQEEWEEMSKSLRRIENALLGDEKMGVRGIVHKVSDHEARFIELEAIKNKGKGMVFTASVFMGLVGAAIAEVFRYFFGK